MQSSLTWLSDMGSQRLSCSICLSTQSVLREMQRASCQGVSSLVKVTRHAEVGGRGRPSHKIRIYLSTLQPTFTTIFHAVDNNTFLSRLVLEFTFTSLTSQAPKKSCFITLAMYATLIVIPLVPRAISLFYREYDVHRYKAGSRIKSASYSYLAFWR